MAYSRKAVRFDDAGYSAQVAVDEDSRDSGVCMEEVPALEALPVSPISILEMDVFDEAARSPQKYSSVKYPASQIRTTFNELDFFLDISAASSIVSPIAVLDFDSDTPNDFSTSSNALLSAPAITPQTQGGDSFTIKRRTTPKLSSQFNSLYIKTRPAIKRRSPDIDDEPTAAALTDSTPIHKRRRRLHLTKRSLSQDVHSTPKLSLRPCLSENEAVIKSTLDRVSEDAQLISDGSKMFCLPTIPGKHEDLKSISPETLARLLNNRYDHVIEKFLIVDCRYPYEFEGGHIEGAKNYYTRQNVMANLVENPIKTTASDKRIVLIFHCEFSSERGPKMCRFLRSTDRDCNKESYPQLYYPEMYVLHGGYKEFFESQKEHCEPQTYIPMRHDDYKEDMRKFRTKSKSWNGETKRSIRRGLQF